MSTALFIVGYYRSGTSALSGALQRAGVKFYNEADPNEHNPLGFYEIPELIEFDARLFAQLGVDWPDIRNLPEGWTQRSEITPFATQLEEILRRRYTQQDRIWGLKHPHLCRTLPLYEQATRRAGHTPHVVHIFREPWVAASSQCRKNGLSRAHALLLWLTYATNAERQARHLPRSWTTYHELLNQPRLVLRRLESELDLRFQTQGGDDLAQACAYLTGQLNRSEALPREQLCRPLEALVERTWETIVTRQFAPDIWDELAAETTDLVGFLSEIGASRARALPSFGGATNVSMEATALAPLNRPPERTDDSSRQRLQHMRHRMGALPRVGIMIAAPTGRAPAVGETLNSLRAQWEQPAFIKVLSADTLTLEDIPTLSVAAEPEAMTQQLCLHLNLSAAEVDYVAILNAGDTIAPDACLRFAMLAAQTKADMLYCDEIVATGEKPWVRHKPSWDITRLRQSAYIGDWVWYGTQALQAAGGFNADMAGAEEYDLQLRLAAQNAHVVRLPEAVFTRHPASKRDDIASPVFCARAVTALTQHLSASQMHAEVQNRQYAGLFQHIRTVADPGTSMIILCDHAEIPLLDKWLTALLSGKPLSGPIILAGASVSPEMQTYLTAVMAQRESLQGQVLAVMAASQGEALARALALVETELVAFLDARMREVTPFWLEQLRARLADKNVAAVAARTITTMGSDGQQGQIMGPIVIGATTRLGAMHAPLDPGPGGWLLVDQEASAIAPPGLLARRSALASCQIATNLSHDALWIDLCAQLRDTGAKLVWVPDVSFVMPADSILPDTECTFRTGSPAARSLPWADPYHHPALALHGDLLAADLRFGLVSPAPADPACLLLTGEAAGAESALNAARTLRTSGKADIDWAPGLPSIAEIGRRAPQEWVCLNPTHCPAPGGMAFTSLFTTMPDTDIMPVLAATSRLYATSPGLMEMLRKLAPRRVSVELWRPALSPSLWQNFQSGTGLNSRPRVLWVDEGFAPSWLPDLMAATQDLVSWLVVERPGKDYPGTVTRLPAQATEQGWVTLLEAVGPQIMIRPAETNLVADCYPLLLGAAAGCRLIIDSRLDAPEALGALRLPNRQKDWQAALAMAVAHLAETLQLGAKTRAAALALPGVEQAPPGWARPVLGSAPMLTQAAE